MNELLKIYTPEQLFEFMRDYVIAQNVGVTDFNAGSVNRAKFEAVANVASMLSIDFLTALRNAIPTALRIGLGFVARSATPSTGYIRLYRLPEFTIEYTGADSSCQITITGTDFTTTTSGTPADNLSLDLTTYPTAADLVNEINQNASYTAVLVGDGTAASTDLYQYSGKEIVANTNYLLATNTVDILVNSKATAISIPISMQVQIDDKIFQAVAGYTLTAGSSTTPPVAFQSVYSGLAQNISALAIDTFNGKGTMLTQVQGIEYIINDSAFANGSDGESDDAVEYRFQQYIQGLNASTTRGIIAAVLSLDGIKSVSVRNNYPQSGQVTVIADDGTGNLSNAQITQILELLEGDPNDFANKPGVVAAGISVNVNAPSVVGIDVTIDLDRVGTLSDETEIELAVQTAIEQYINTRRLGQNVIRSEIARIAKTSHPAIYDLTVTVPATNTTISDSELARTGAGTGYSVTVNITTLPIEP